MIYTVDYFINKFEAIPDNEWTMNSYIDKLGRHCALGHCGCTNPNYTIEGKALENLFEKHLCTAVTYVNDDREDLFKQQTPKSRVIAALKEIKQLI